MNNSLIKPHKQETALDRERRRMQESLALLEPVREARHKAASSPKREARLIFGLDLTASREWSLDQARLATAGMFAAIQDIGSVAVKLVYYRGTNECRESPWYGNMDLLCRSMMGLACKCGGTQIERILKCALREIELLSGVVFIGDACEESHRELEVLAAKLGQAQVPLFIFHECGDDRRSRDAKRLFKRMAQLSGAPISNSASRATVCYASCYPMWRPMRQMVPRLSSAWPFHPRMKDGNCAITCCSGADARSEKTYGRRRFRDIVRTGR